MDEEILENYIRAGEIAAAVLKKGSREVKVGASYLTVVETVEEMVRSEGADLAFPLNVSRNEDAAHDTASSGDERIFISGDLVKLDLGVHIDGYIADTALTVDLGDHTKLVDASRSALSAAIALVKPGARVGDLGAAIQRTIESAGYKPVVNLTGHGLARFGIHTAPSIPNIAVSGGQRLEEGMVFAIEPFATTGAGHVTDRPRVEIFSQISAKPVRLTSARQIVEAVRNRKGLPFSRRWLPVERPEIALSALVRAGVLHPYPVLGDRPGSFVSQAEHSVVTTADGCVVTTI